MLPSTEQREWKDLNRRLIVSLNHGKDETTLSGAPIMFQIDEQGWRPIAGDDKLAPRGRLSSI